jgi:phosphocarrier protein HPr
MDEDANARMDETMATSSVVLTNAIGLHARPSVKLTKLAKTFSAAIELAAAPDGPWVDAKSIVKVMAVKATKGATLYFRARGHDAKEALAAVGRLAGRGFDDPGGHEESARGEANG